MQDAIKIGFQFVGPAGNHKTENGTRPTVNNCQLST